MFDISKSLKLQAYLNNQNLDNDMLGKLTSMRFNDMYTTEEFADIKYKVETYRNLDKVNRETPTSEGSKRLKELSEDILYATGLDANAIQLSELFTTDILDKAFAETNLRSKNDLYVTYASDNYLKVAKCFNEDEEKFKLYKEEKNKYKDRLVKRAQAFVQGAKGVQLEILPYRDGFFISIPCDNPKVICEELTKENLYLIPLKMGLRFAVCAVSEEKCKKAPKIIKDVLDKVKLSDSGLV